MTAYTALIHKDPESDFGVSFPDFPGCTTVGRSLEEARTLAQEALEFHIEEMNKDGAALPAPLSLDTIMQKPDFADGVAFLVTVRTPGRTVRVNVTLDETLLEAIASVSRNRSRFLAEAAWEKIERQRGAE
ncbi:type II toxin-antitoxin system HicB family antitoxin [Asaia spathodeae]|uniref:Type II toxin-antitoxin system HicB family antitoxin n=1 Tax=Asaia spathodeae TaxID=657016 RepID=A0ABX2P1F9_9PROT|nr:type II toxin-antitoxin system HicB family antitoxin [Asaia spathodeae]GBR14677.1 hypothetical protein AA105894_1141 [Asaia spathodeae NBRC 105894]